MISDPSEADPLPFTAEQLAWLRGTFQPQLAPLSSADETIPASSGTMTTPASSSSAVSGEYRYQHLLNRPAAFLSFGRPDASAPHCFRYFGAPAPILTHMRTLH